MKTVLHKASDRGFANYDWLQANYSFSFANYFNPDKIQFGTLRVLNDDIIAPGMGFSTHPHDNMEIITIPLKGTLKHKDSMHNQWQEIKTGEVQVMSAGSGLMHSEINASQNEYLNLFQIWIFPNEKNVEPRYDQKFYDESERKNKLQTLVSSMDSKDKNSLKIHQDAKISRLSLDSGKSFDYKLDNPSNGVYIMTVNGKIEIDNTSLETRDAIGIWNSDAFTVISKEESDILFLEVPMQ